MDKNKFLKQAKKLLSIASSVAEVAVHLQKPTFFGATLVAAKAAKTYQDLTKEEENTFFKDWIFYKYHLSDDLYDVLKINLQLRYEECKNQNQGQNVTANIYGHQIGWVVHEGYKSGPFIKKGVDKLKTNNAMTSVFWERYGNNLKLYRNSEFSYSLTEDVLTESHTSQTADILYKKLSAYTAKGYHRAALIHGEPGTGKSHIMRSVAKNFGNLTLRLSSNGLRGTLVTKLIKALQPNVLLLDDLDLAADPASIMDVFEEIKVSVPVFLVSVNDLSKLEPATLRVGRFDEKVEILKLDDQVLDKLLMGIPPGIAAQLRTLPVAYIDEYKKAIDVYGEDFDAMAEIQQLVARTEEVRKRMKNKEENKEITKKVIGTTKNGAVIIA